MRTGTYDLEQYVYFFDQGRVIGIGIGIRS